MYKYVNIHSNMYFANRYFALRRVNSPRIFRNFHEFQQTAQNIRAMFLFVCKYFYAKKC